MTNALIIFVIGVLLWGILGLAAAALIGFLASSATDSFGEGMGLGVLLIMAGALGTFIFDHETVSRLIGGLFVTPALALGIQSLSSKWK